MRRTPDTLVPSRAVPPALGLRPPAPARPVPTPEADRRAPLMRRVEVAWLSASGEVREASRLVPALAPFEEAFAAFARGTLFATDRGYAAVEDLWPGMRVRVAGGSLRTLLWRGSLLVGGSGSDRVSPEMTRLTRVSSGALGAGRPFPDLLLGPHARVVRRTSAPWAQMGGAALVPAARLVDGEGIVTVAPASPVEVFHLGFAGHERLEAQGVAVGSQHPAGLARQRLAPALLDLWLSCFPHRRSLADWGPPALPCPPMTDAGLPDEA